MAGNRISSWRSKGLSNEKNTSASTSYSNKVPKLVYNNARIKLKLAGVLLKQDKVTYTHGPIVNIYIVYRLILLLKILVLLYKTVYLVQLN